MTFDSPAPAEAFPARFGNYQLIRPLGQGGQGRVYLAEDLKLRRPVALKLLSPRFASSADARMRLEREAEASARINHACIAKIFEIGEHESVVYLAMEYIEGRTLASYIDDARVAGSISCWINGEKSESVMPPVASSASTRPESSTHSSNRPSSASSPRSGSDRQALTRLVGIFEQACRGLHAAHEKQLVHRDLKPGNIMIRPDGSPVIIDFGLAHDAESEGVTLTHTGQILGTLDYMPPEQIHGKSGGVDPRSDVYAMGVALFECCTLAKPFQAATRHDLMRAITSESPRRPRNINSRLPTDLEAIILTAIDHDPRWRYQTAAALADDLGRFQRHEPIQARPIGPMLRSLRWVGRNRLLSLTIAVIFAALLTIAWVSQFKSQEARSALAAEVRERRAKEDALEENKRLSDVSRLEAAEAAANTLFPPSPDLIPGLESWLIEFSPLAERLEGHQSNLARLRERALPYEEPERARDFAREIDEKARLKAALELLEEERLAAPTPQLPARLEKKRVDTEARVAELEGVIKNGRRSWRFGDPADQFKNDVLRSLIASLEHFANDETGAVKTVARRIEKCREIARVTLDEATADWRACQERIKAEPRYAGLDLDPQLGLIPLGPDPESGLEEFLHWMTHEGPLPQRDPVTGRIEQTVDLGIILVLIPGGSFLMGSQTADSGSPNYDPDAGKEEGPVHPISLRPYFLGKCEMSQGQWLRAFGENPSKLGPGFIHPSLRRSPDLRHPVEQVSWEDCKRLLPQIDLGLPTEAEWERAARAGRTDLVYAGTSSLDELPDFANISGSETSALGFNVQQPNYRDDSAIHAPIGSRRPNAYGLHDMTGNVWEWCLDGADVSYKRMADSRGLRRDPIASENRIARGGSFNVPASSSRVAFRYPYAPSARGNVVGLRPVRLIAD